MKSQRARILLVFLLMVCGSIGCAKKTPEEQAIAAIKKLEGRIKTGPNKRVDVFLKGSQVTDASLEYLKTLTSLQTLDLSVTQITDAGVKELEKTLPNVRITH